METNKDDHIFKFINFRPASGSSGEDTDAASIHNLRASVTKPSKHKKPPAPPPTVNDILVAMAEIESIDEYTDLHLPSNGSNTKQRDFIIKEEVRNRLTNPTQQVLAKLGIDITSVRYMDILEKLDRFLARDTGTVFTSGEADSESAQPILQDVGIGELNVVKSHIKRYEANEVAHIENVLAGETRSREHRELNRTETFSNTISESEYELESELQTSDRFELNKETSKTAQRDQQLGSSLSLSGKYGPSVEFSSSVSFDQSTSTETTQNNSIDYAKELIERSKERIVERVRTERQRRVIREREETNKHCFENDGTDGNTIGVYQFVDKIYSNQVFNYGLRQLFDFMIPEPASYKWKLTNDSPPNPELPAAPPPLEQFAKSASAIHEGNYLTLGALYGVDGLKPPPPRYVVKTARIDHGEGDESEGDNKPKSKEAAEIEIPEGYKPKWMHGSVIGTTDEDVTIGISAGQLSENYIPSPGDATALNSGNLKMFHNGQLFFGFPTDAYVHTDQQKLFIDVYAYETAKYTLHFRAVMGREKHHMTSWKIATYETIKEAYQNALAQYQQDVEVILADAEAEEDQLDPFGAPPSSIKAIILAELKKHCITVIRGQNPGELATPHTDTLPPQFDINEAKENGAEIRFLETAFEWDQMQYVFYPYFWGDTEMWPKRFKYRDGDYEMEQFLKAGAARVVVPVRPNFDAAVSHYLIEKEPYQGEGEPNIEHPLYKPIVEEIKERAGNGLGEVALGDSWETRVPTALVILRQDGKLPSWNRANGNNWTWTPADD